MDKKNKSSRPPVPEAPREKKRLTPADIIARISIVLLGLVTGVGAYYTYLNLFFGLAWGSVTALLTFVMLRAAVRLKPKSKIGAGVCLTLLVATALFGVPPLSHYNAIMSHKNEVRRIAGDDINNVRYGILDFQRQELQALYNTCAAMKSANANRRAIISDNVSKFRMTRRLYSERDIERYRREQMDLINNLVCVSDRTSLPEILGIDSAASVSDDYASSGDSSSATSSEGYFPAWDKKLSDAESSIAAWDKLSVPMALKEIEDVDKEAAEMIPEIGRRLIYPVIQKNGRKYVMLSSNHTVRLYTPVATVRSYLDSLSYFNLKGAAVILILLILILLKYAATPGKPREVRNIIMNKTTGIPV